MTLIGISAIAWWVITVIFAVVIYLGALSRLEKRDNQGFLFGIALVLILLLSKPNWV